MKIAIIDDDPIFQFLVKRALVKIAPGHELLRFDDGQQAFDYLESWLPLHQAALPALILLDINMPHMNGWQFLDSYRALQAVNYRPHIYLVSSSSDPADLSKSQTYPELKGYLKKPLSVQQMNDLFTAKRD